jgi:hypothetical protein
MANQRKVPNLKTVLGRRRAEATDRRRRFAYDPFFADPDSVEDDYRRLRRGDG